MEEPDDETQERIRGIIRRGLKKDYICVRFIGIGKKGFEKFLLVEIDVQDDLANREIDHSEFLKTGYMTNIVTSRPSFPGSSFVSRMFAPLVNVNEDHVCGSAHCMLVPYWTQKLGENGNGFMRARQVGPRGGELDVVWLEDEERVLLRGECRVVMKGKLWV
ncbi:hypothetical protein NLI96_g3019 [Meripilus lineatus]|uniref:Phenazine biosynthesis-like protein n=1 Tax=Meripilus lineatus TaxID=2056292 RepID=A0AAD5V9T3_9APHY|nr:hypothetical protein NLI96_g3019 [Physisporinus lineatus]